MTPPWANLLSFPKILGPIAVELSSTRATPPHGVEIQRDVEYSSAPPWLKIRQFLEITGDLTMTDDALTFTMRFWGTSDPENDAEIARLRDERPVTYRLIVAIEKRRVRGEIIEHLDITAADMAALELELGGPVVSFRGYPLQVVDWHRHG